MKENKWKNRWRVGKKKNENNPTKKEPTWKKDRRATCCFSFWIDTTAQNSVKPSNKKKPVRSGKTKWNPVKYYEIQENWLRTRSNPAKPAKVQ